MFESMPAWLALVIFLMGFGFLIFIHELGHFLAAKWAGVHCTQFAIGMAHAIFSYRKGMGLRVGSTEPEFHDRVDKLFKSKGVAPELTERIKQRDDTEKVIKRYSPKQYAEAAEELELGETEYRFNWLPIGGYVKMVGQEDLDPTATSDDPRAFNQQPFWPRAIIISAGVFMNAVFALIFFMIAFSIGVAFPPAKIGNVLPDSPAATTAAVDHPDVIGLQMGDRVISVNGEKPNDFMDLQIASALAASDAPVDIVVERPGIDDIPTQTLQFIITPRPNPRLDGIRGIGVTPATDVKLVNEKFANPVQLDRLQQHQVAPGMILTAVNDQPVNEYWQYKHYANRSQGNAMTLRFEADPKEPSHTSLEPVTVSAAPEMTELMGGTGGVPPHFLGIVPMTEIQDAIEDSPAHGVLKAGDLLWSVGGRNFPSAEAATEVIRANDGVPVEIEVIRQDKRVTLSVTPKNKRLGVFLRQSNQLYVRELLSDSPFADQRLENGSKVLKINDTPVTNFRDLRVAIESDDDGVFDATFMIPAPHNVKETREITLNDTQQEVVASLGWEEPLPGGLFLQLQQPYKADGIGQAVSMGVAKTHDFMMQTYLTLGGLLQGNVPAKAMRGPVGIADVGTTFTQRGVAWFLFFLGLISINLAVINFLPLPIVDGGLFLLLCIEKLRGRPVSPQVQNAIMIAGIALLGTLFLVITFYDIQRLVG